MRAGLERYFSRIWYGSTRPGLVLKSLSALHGRLLRGRWHRPSVPPTVPVIVVGNLTVGGGGKTPVVMALARHLATSGRRVAVISRGYGGKPQARPLRVRPDSKPDVCGDEPVLIARSVPVPVWVCIHRELALEAAVADGAQVVLADDGLQHQTLARSFEICVIDGQRGLGNRRLLPAGPLRQPVERLDQVDIVLTKEPAAADDPLGYRLKADALTRLDGSDPISPGAWSGLSVDAVCGIANPESFFASLEALGMKPRGHGRPDHHAFGAGDFDGLAGPIVVTAKDAVKLMGLNILPEIRVLQVRAVLPAKLIGRLEQHLLEFQS